jgi:hypothetical protein
VLDICSLRKRDRSIKLAILPLRPTNPSISLFVLKLAFTLDDEKIVVDFNPNVFLCKTRQFRRDNELAIAKRNFCRWGPCRAQEVIASLRDSESSLAKNAVHVTLHSSLFSPLLFAS